MKIKSIIKTLLILALAVGGLWYGYSYVEKQGVSVVSNSNGPKKAIVMGASSGIGKELAKVLSAHGYEVGLTARRTDLLEQLQKELPAKSYVKSIDVRNSGEAMQQLAELINEMGGLDLIVLNAGVGYMDADQYWLKQKQMIEVNVYGFTAMANVALNYFVGQKRGHIVGISSIAAIRGNAHAYTYCGTKAYISTYLEGLRSAMNVEGLPIYVTDIKPGFVDTDLTKSVVGKFWEATSEVAAQQIYDTIEAKRDHAYVTKRWRLIAWLMKISPDWLLHKVDRHKVK